MTTFLHPLQLLSRTDADITTILHSVFLVEMLDSGHINIAKKIPLHRDRIDAVETGLSGLFTTNSMSKSQTKEAFGMYVVTINDGSRFFIHWKAYKRYIFVAVSRLPMEAFCRKIFDLIGLEDSHRLYPILLGLCEIPIYPAYSINYDVHLSHGKASIEFSCTEQVNDTDSNYIVLNVLTPNMLVSAWEAMILERKVLVVSSITAILTPVCEFIRRIILPLPCVNAFIPVLPANMIDAIDAPVRLCPAAHSL